MKTGIVASGRLVLKALGIIAAGLLALQGSAAADNTVKGSMKFADKSVTYTDAAAGVCKLNGRVVVHLAKEKIDFGKVIKELQEDGMAAGFNKLELAFDNKGKLKNHSFQFSEGGGSYSGGGMSAEGIESKVTIAKGRAKGRVHSKKPLELFDDKYTFDVTFDVEIADGK